MRGLKEDKVGRKMHEWQDRLKLLWLGHGSSQGGQVNNSNGILNHDDGPTTQSTQV